MCTVSGPIICIENTDVTPIVPDIPEFHFVTGIRSRLWRVQHKMSWCNDRPATVVGTAFCGFAASDEYRTFRCMQQTPRRWLRGMCTVSAPIICIDNTASTPIVPAVPTLYFVTHFCTRVSSVTKEISNDISVQNRRSGPVSRAATVDFGAIPASRRRRAK